MVRILPQRRSATAVVVAKVHPSPGLDAGDLTRALDDLDRRIREALPLVADVYIDVTARRARDGARARQHSRP